MQILLAVLVLGGLGLVFGILLTIASKIFHVEIDPRVEEVRACLAGANCGACGYAGCDACAQAVVKGEAGINCCPPGGAAAAEGIAKIMGVAAEVAEPKVARVLCQGADGVAAQRYIYDGYKSCHAAAGLACGPKECRYACIGLGDCVEHCPFGAISIQNGIAHIDEKLCKACGNCVAVCPRSVIQMMPASAKVLVRCRNMDAAKPAFAVCTASCIGCGRCVKACTQEAIQVVDGFAHIDTSKCTQCGECAKVCPRKCITVE